jgi:hypothetical protein
MELDHVLYGVGDLDKAAARFLEEYGLTSVEGGRHPQLGTANRIIPVGRGQFLELIAVVDQDSPHPVAKVLGALVSNGDRLFASCLRPDDLDAVAQRLSLSPVTARRNNPDGSVHEWRLAGLDAAAGPDRLPFFIDWGSAPGWSHLEPRHTVETRGFAWLETGGDASRLRDWIGDDRVPIRVVAGEPGPHAVAIATPDGELVIR